MLDEFLSPWTLLIKSLGLALAVASGLSLGKEVDTIPLFLLFLSNQIQQGPLVHVSCCLAYLLSGMFKSLRQNEGLLNFEYLSPNI